MNDPVYLYHWTHRNNLPSILRRGLDPDWSECKQPKVWLCEGRRVAWGLVHISQRHGWDAGEMVLIRIAARAVEPTRTAFDGVFTVAETVFPDTFRGIRYSLLDKWCPLPEGSRTPPRAA